MRGVRGESGRDEGCVYGGWVESQEQHGWSKRSTDCWVDLRCFCKEQLRNSFTKNPSLYLAVDKMRHLKDLIVNIHQYV